MLARILPAVLLALPSAAAAATPSVAFTNGGPNPVTVKTDVPALTRDIFQNRYAPTPADEGKPFKQCVKPTLKHAWLTPEPVLTVDVGPGVKTLRFAAMRFPGFVVERPDKGFYCGASGSVQVPDPPAGRYRIFALSLTNDATPPPAAAGQILTIYDPTRAATLDGFGDRTLTIGEGLTDAVTLEGALQGDRVYQPRGCKRPDLFVAPEPDFIVRLGAVPTRLWVAVASAHAQLLYRPLTESAQSMRSPKCHSSLDEEAKLKKPGTYAVWVAVPAKRAGKPFKVTALGPKAKKPSWFSPLAKPERGGTTAERMLGRHYPFQERFGMPPSSADRDAITQMLWEHVDPRLWVYAKGKRSWTGATAGEPAIIYVDPSNDNDTLVTLEGRTHSLHSNAVTVERPESIVFPIDVPERIPSTITGAEAIKAVTEPAVHDLIDKTFAKQAKFKECFDKVFRKYDSTGNAYRKELVTRRNGRVVKVENWGSKIEKRAYKRCKGKRMDKAWNAMQDKAAASYAKLHRQRLQARAEMARRRWEAIAK